MCNILLPISDGISRAVGYIPNHENRTNYNIITIITYLHALYTYT